MKTISSMMVPKKPRMIHMHGLRSVKMRSLRLQLSNKRQFNKLLNPNLRLLFSSLEVTLDGDGIKQLSSGFLIHLVFRINDSPLAEFDISEKWW